MMTPFSQISPADKAPPRRALYWIYDVTRWIQDSSVTGRQAIKKGGEVGYPDICTGPDSEGRVWQSPQLPKGYNGAGSADPCALDPTVAFMSEAGVSGCGE